MHPALARHLLQAGELGEGIGMVVDAQVVEGVILAVVDQQRGGLLAALVAAGRLAARMAATRRRANARAASAS